MNACLKPDRPRAYESAVGLMHLRSGRVVSSTEPVFGPVPQTGRTSALSIVRTRILTRIIHALHASAPSDPEMWQLLGVTDWNDVLDYLETFFDADMTWKNIRQWDLDHRLPVSAFDLTNPAHRKACFHVTNLRPMWWWDNRRKGTRYAVSDWKRHVRRFERGHDSIVCNA